MPETRPPPGSTGSGRPDGSPGSARPSSGSLRPVALAFGVPPTMDEPRQRELLAIVTAHLGRRVGAPIVPFRSLGFAELGAAIRAGIVHLAWTSPATFVALERDLDVRGLAAPLRGSGEGDYATFVSHASAGIRRLEDVVGKRVAWVDEGSASGYVFQRWQLASAGIDPRTAFAEEIFARTHPGVVRAVIEGAADVGATFFNRDADRPDAIATAGWLPLPEGVEAGDLAHLPPFGPVPPDVVVATAAVPDEVGAKIADALLSLEDDASIADAARELFGQSRFTPVDLARYDEIRRALDRARALGLAG